MQSRRNFFRTAGAAALGVAAVSRVGAASLPEAPTQGSPDMQPLLVPESGRPYNPVATLNGWSLPWRMKDNVKEFHLVAEPVVRELAPGMKANRWVGRAFRLVQRLAARPLSPHADLVDCDLPGCKGLRHRREDGLRTVDPDDLFGTGEHHDPLPMILAYGFGGECDPDLVFFHGAFLSIATGWRGSGRAIFTRRWQVIK